MIKKEIQQDKEELRHRRRGGAFDDFARVLRKINKAIFGTGSVIEDRPGAESSADLSNPDSYVKSRSVFEFYQMNSPKNGTYNLMYLGRKGLGTYKNTNYLEITANSKSGEIGRANGSVLLTLSRDGVEYKGSLIGLFEGLNVGTNQGARAMISGNAGVQISYVDSNGNSIYAIVLDQDGVQFYGLPTSNPGGTNKLYKSGGYIRIT